MHAKQFAEQQVALIRAWNSYAQPGRADAEALAVVDADVRKFMSDHDVKDYGQALKLRRSEVRALEEEVARAPSAFEATP
jgi:hypothetical protein